MVVVLEEEVVEEAHLPVAIAKHLHGIEQPGVLPHVPAGLLLAPAPLRLNLHKDFYLTGFLFMIYLIYSLL